MEFWLHAFEMVVIAHVLHFVTETADDLVLALHQCCRLQWLCLSLIEALHDTAGQRLRNGEDFGNGSLAGESNLEVVVGCERVCGMPINAMRFQVRAERRFGAGREGKAAALDILKTVFLFYRSRQNGRQTEQGNEQAGFG